jgi:hypothetical protein
MFLPKQYQVKDFSGDAMARSLFPDLADAEPVRPAPAPRSAFNLTLLPGQLGGFVVDPTGSPIRAAQIAILAANGSAIAKAVTSDAGRWQVSNVSSGRIRVQVQAPGYQQYVSILDYDARHPDPVSSALQIGSVSETVEVTAENGRVLTSQIQRQASQNAAADTAPSGNILDLQKRVAGVLPIRVDVPRAGNSFRFVRPLVIDEETRVSFRYKSR